MSISDRSRSPASHRSGPTSSRPELSKIYSLVWSNGLSCPNLTSTASYSDHPKMARNTVENLWVVTVSTSDDASTIGSVQLDQCSSISTIPPISSSATQHSTYASFHLRSHATVSVNSECAHQFFSDNIQVPSTTSSTIQYPITLVDRNSGLWL